MPDTARVVERWREGRFAVFMGASLYNRKGIFLKGKWVDAYSAPHNSIDERDFFAFFKKVFGKKDGNLEEVKTYIKPDTTRLKDVLLTKEQVCIIRNFIDNYSKIDDDDSEGEPRISNGFDLDWEKAEAIDKQKWDIINELSDGDLQLLNAVMYSGRDNDPPYGLTLNHQLSFHTERSGNEHELAGRYVDGVCRLLEKGIEMFT